jgi:uncharacterized HAD superfamily protein
MSSDEHGLPIGVGEREPEMGLGIRVPAVVFDIDGVLCDSAESMAAAIEEARGDARRVDWATWNRGAFPCHPEYVALAQLLANADIAVILLTARQEDSTEATEKWLIENDVPYDELLMRPMDHAYETWKADAIQALQNSPYDVQLVLDDSYHHANSMRACGVPVIQVHSSASLLQ